MLPIRGRNYYLCPGAKTGFAATPKASPFPIQRYLSLPPMLPIETVAIVEATAPDVHAKAAAITFRMWHHLPSEAARRLLFAEFALDGRVVGLLEAIAAAA